MTELKEIIIPLLFGTVFAVGFAMGIFSAIGFYYSSKRKKEIDQEEEEAIAEQQKEEPKTLRDYCIDITKYTYEQRNYIYRLLIYLNEPIFRGYDNVVSWISKDYKPTIVISSFMQFIGFSEQNGWIELSKSEVKSKNLTEVDYNTFIKIMNGTDLYSTYQELFNHMDEEHDLILLQSEMDDIIRIVNRIK